jgi:hypothetical protein
MEDIYRLVRRLMQLVDYPYFSPHIDSSAKYYFLKYFPLAALRLVSGCGGR